MSLAAEVSSTLDSAATAAPPPLPEVLVTADSARVGLIVTRSSFWAEAGYGDQDGGPESAGELLGWTDALGQTTFPGGTTWGGGELAQALLLRAPPLHAVVRWSAPSAAPPLSGDEGGGGGAALRDEGGGAVDHAAAYTDMYPIGHLGWYCLCVHRPPAPGVEGAVAAAGVQAGRNAAGAAATAAKPKKPPRGWEVKLEGGWAPYDDATSVALESLYQRSKPRRGGGRPSRPQAGGGGAAEGRDGGGGGGLFGAAGGSTHLAKIKGEAYLINIAAGTQRNVVSGFQRPVRRAPAGSPGSPGSPGGGRARSAALKGPRLELASDGKGLAGTDDALLGALPAALLGLAAPEGGGAAPGRDFASVPAAPLPAPAPAPLDVLAVAGHKEARLLCERLVAQSLEDPRRLAAALLPDLPSSAGESGGHEGQEHLPNDQSILRRLRLVPARGGGGGGFDPTALLGCGGGRAVAGGSVLLAKLAAMVLFEGQEAALKAPEFQVASRAPERALPSGGNGRAEAAAERRQYLSSFLWEALEAEAAASAEDAVAAATAASVVTTATHDAGGAEAAKPPRLRSRVRGPDSGLEGGTPEGGGGDEGGGKAGMDEDGSAGPPPDAYPPSLRRQLTEGLPAALPGSSVGAARGLPRSYRFLQFITRDAVKVRINPPFLLCSFSLRQKCVMDIVPRGMGGVGVAVRYKMILPCADFMPPPAAFRMGCP